MGTAPQFHRIDGFDRRPVTCFVDTAPVTAFEGDTVLTAVLTHRRDLRRFDFSNDARSGFCLMGACQDCWVFTDAGDRIRACSTLIEDGLHIVTRRKGEADV